MFNQADGSFLRFNQEVFSVILKSLSEQKLSTVDEQFITEIREHFPIDTDEIIIQYTEKLRKTTPEFSQSPEMIDLSILSYCNLRCEFCYMGSVQQGIHLSMKDFHHCMEELSQNRVLQVAIGGGEPTLHPNFTEIIHSMRHQYDIIPNYTTNGILLDGELCQVSQDCGAIAISYHPQRQQEILEKVRLLREHDLNTTLHVVVMKENYSLLKEIIEPFCQAGINAVAFLLFKPMGRGDKIRHQILEPKDTLQLLNDLPFVFDTANQYGTSVGFDSCFAPFLTQLPLPRFVYDSCVGARFIAHIDWNLDVRPCSFIDLDQGLNLKECSLQEIWWSKWFREFRDQILNQPATCQSCSDFSHCHGGCPSLPEITLCDKNPKMGVH